ncbi:SGNH/GDSL hydrolase family protein [Modestobacter sp. VKM Ac-2979]|uniref:SGNH/GDSL hydrolase family protein n=1 Tax=unclassified Modestobacter TaxID=2643866 RepID=UPI0022ABBD03|nr:MULTISPECIES: SGNH/GDSL hydrolase family protein [unclassified Modestobacter]MCZ2814171.1 SGNH/GDSL hydrolase family protein [Modestobacter sp. VKM Ac-2979]MCZ2844413.1 SGNH/GDSL hydrolase family protein [Modestobacter sp. VKM Ac-2980]
MTRYVALGSSFAAGPGIDPILHPGCARSGRNYAHLLAERLGYDLVDVTSGGATIDDVLTRPQALLIGGTMPPQIDAVGPDTDLVTVTVGGNDVEYLLTLLRCSFQADPEGTPLPARAFFGTPVDPGAVSTALAALPDRLARLVEEVSRRAPRARVVLVDYLTVVPAEPTAAFPMHEEHRRLCADVGRRLEVATAAAARDSGADLVAASAISRDHAVGSRDPWVTGWVFGDLLGGGVAPYHPNAAGMRAVADLLVEQLSADRAR